jgi:hypothetical protein
LACEHGYLSLAQWLLTLGGSIDIPVQIRHVFQEACLRGHLELAQWLYSLREGDVHFDEDYLFRITCMKDNLLMAKWLYSLGGISVEILEKFVNYTRCGIEVRSWLRSILKGVS